MEEILLKIEKLLLKGPALEIIGLEAFFYLIDSLKSSASSSDEKKLDGEEKWLLKNFLNQKKNLVCEAIKRNIYEFDMLGYIRLLLFYDKKMAICSKWYVEIIEKWVALETFVEKGVELLQIVLQKYDYNVDIFTPKLLLLLRTHKHRLINVLPDIY
jgi:hypothetical protein